MALAYDEPRPLGATRVRRRATAVVNARLYASVREGEARLRAIQELSSRLNRIQDVGGIAEAIVAEADKLIAHDTIRVYRVDEAAGMCEPIGFQGEFLGIGRPSSDVLRVPIGEGLTGWVAQHNESIRVDDASTDPRARHVGTRRGGESMLLVPMSYEKRVLGVIVVSKVGLSSFSDDDQRTLEIFAGYAAQALVNAEAFGQVRRQQQELSHRLESQRRLLEVNERLLATLDPSGVLEMIADSLKTVVAYDSLTIYRVDRSAGVRRAVVARDEFADQILAHEINLTAGITGWAIQHGEAALANDAHTDPRSMLIPGTPLEPESLIVCPLLVGGIVIGTLNLARMGHDESHFTQDEFELVQLFAAQASIALRNAEAHGAVVTQAQHDALTGLRNHGAFQRELGEWIARREPFAVLMLDLDRFKAYNDSHGHPAGDRLLARIAGAMTASIRAGDRLYRYGGDEFAILLPRVSAREAREVTERVREAVAGLTRTAGPSVTVSVGIALFPDDAATKDALAAFADRALYLAKPADRSRACGHEPRLEVGATGAPVTSAAATIAPDGAGTTDADALTGLASRTSLLARLAELAATPGRARHAPTAATGATSTPVSGRHALILLDLDRFNLINETLGHPAGDQLLTEVGRRLAHVARATDTVARLGSDEFGVLLGTVRSAREAHRVAARIRVALERPFDLGGHDVVVSASLGVAVGPMGDSADRDLLKEAEIALHRAKSDPLERMVVFDPEMRTQALERGHMEHGLRHAIERDELRLHYQPIVDLADGAIVGVEALVRWQHPDRGLVPPLAFVPLAEETGLIVPIGRWVLETACRQARRWQERGRPTLKVSVNLSARQFAQPDLALDVATILDATGLDAATLELEITESVVMDQSEASIERLRRLRELGVRLVLDDFGTGYSSLAYLRRLPLDTLKIDRSFVAGLGSPDASLPIVRAVISMAHGLGLDVVGEGIETTDQLDRLRELECERGQGFLYAQPLPPDAVEVLLDRSAALRRITA